MVDATVAGTTDSQSVLRNSHHYVSLSPRLAWRLQVRPKRQVRLTGPTGMSGAYTVWTVHEDANVDLRLPSAGRTPLKVAVGDTITVSTIVPTATDIPTAQDEDGVAETIDRNGDELLVAAPHAGNIEPGTGDIAARIHTRMNEYGIESSFWRLYTSGTDTFERYHIHSSNLDPAAYPELRRVADKRYGLALSVHGHSKDYISVGGTAPKRHRSRLADAIERELPDTDVRFCHDAGANMGSTGKNFVNWLSEGSTGGIQLEIPLRHRQDERQQIVDGVVAGLEALFRSGIDSLATEGPNS